MMDTSGDTLKKKIIAVIKQHPEGLTIQDLAGILKAHRQTITKYILFLEGAGTIYRRRIGSATLHYLRIQYEAFHSSEKSKKERRPSL